MPAKPTKSSKGKGGSGAVKRDECCRTEFTGVRTYCGCDRTVVGTLEENAECAVARKT